MLGGPDRQSVAMVTDDPEHKKNLKAALAGAFDDNTISKYISSVPCSQASTQLCLLLHCHHCLGSDNHVNGMTNGVSSPGMLLSLLDIPRLANITFIIAIRLANNSASDSAVELVHSITFLVLKISS